MANDPGNTGQSGAEGANNALGSGDQGGTAGATWFDTLPEGMKSDPSLQAFKGKEVSAVVESYINAQKLVGGSIRVPGKDAKPEERQAFLTKVYEATGRPAAPDKYNVKRPAAEELGIVWDDKRHTEALAIAHRLGLNDTAAQEMVNYIADNLKAEQPNHAEDYKACIEKLEKGDAEAGIPGWGSTTPRFLGVAKRVVDTMFPKGTMEKLDASGLANDPDFIRGLHRLGKELIEEGIITGEELNPTTGEVETAQARLDKIMKDQEHPYWKPTHPEHDKATEEALSLRRFLFG